MSTWRENLKFAAPGVPYGERLVPNVIDEAAEKDPNRILVMIPKKPDISQGWFTLSTKNLADYVNCMSWWLEERLGKSEHIETIAYLGANDFRFLVIELAAIKSGYCTLLLSPRNSPGNTLNLLGTTNCKAVFYTADRSTQIAKLKQQTDEIPLFLFPSIEEIQQTPPKPKHPYNKTWEMAKDDPVIIVHTSGSTGDPKPVYYTNRFLAVMDLDRLVPPCNGRTCGGLNMYGDSNTAYLVGSPMFHLSGLANSMAPLWAGATMILPPSDMPPTASIVVEMMKHVEIHGMALPSSIWEELVGEYQDEFLAVSRYIKHVTIGGGPLARAVGDWLSERFYVMNGIGSSETGLLHSLIPEKEDWEYFEWHPTHVGYKMEPIGDDEGLHEMVLYRDPDLSKFQGVFITQPDIDVWRTRDLFEKHPTKDMWKFRGRRDDVIVLSNGEKFNPVIAEGIIMGHPKVAGAVVVGMQRLQCALLVELRDKIPRDTAIDEIWPTVERANLESPGHGHISRNLIMVIPPDKPFKRAGKGTIIRPVVVKDFEAEIDCLYDTFESAAANIDLPTLEYPPDDERTKTFIKQLVAYQWNDPDLPSDTDDLFNAGFDSLQASQFSTNLQAALRDKLLNKRKITPKLIYENPNIEKISSALKMILDQEATDDRKANGVDDTGDHMNGTGAEEEHKFLLQRLVTEFSTPYLSKGVEKKYLASKEYLHVLVTGTTGSLGHSLVEALLSDPMIGRVSCFNRASNAEEIFLARTKATKNPRLDFFQVLFGHPNFGLEKETLERLQQEVDVIIHNAWKVDFNQSLESFVDVHIQGLDHFISWCLTSTKHPSLYFVSSVSSMSRWSAIQNPLIPESVSDDCRVAAPNGYGSSKYVAERMLEAASRAGVRAFIFRIGQISGPVRTETGRWNDNEWFPSLVKTSKALKMLPENVGAIGDIDWIPLDVLTDIMTEIIHSTVHAEVGPGAKVFNLVNPHKVKFDVLAQAIKKEYLAEIVPYRTWIQTLEKLESTRANFVRYPALKLLDFFRANEQPDESTASSKVWDTRESEKASQTMLALKPACADDMKMWIKQWAY
ncbi:hypothetical protein CLAIMM_00129 [Cladophialophora immunda]|nr:hypothetical protein CLAIMM_00129 [Cladophialophora immunda]